MTYAWPAGFAQVASKYDLVSDATLWAGAPTAWTVLGSNDNFTSSTTLDSQSSVAWTANTAETKTYTFVNANKYLAYRLAVTAVAGADSGGVTLREWTLYKCHDMRNCAGASSMNVRDGVCRV